ncbi:Ltp family lipoprotein [Acetobacterium sp.]|uniref:Ltp family lipoprotein n=1 Tax=Acetobacterium sp. TaxID=1872094 RepID=UPI003593B2F8
MAENLGCCEGFSTEDSTYAADNCGTNWNEQAAKKTKSYLDFTSFSRDGLIDHLLYEGFTSDQAEYGVTAVGY